MAAAKDNRSVLLAKALPLMQTSRLYPDQRDAGAQSKASFRQATIGAIRTTP